MTVSYNQEEHLGQQEYSHCLLNLDDSSNNSLGRQNDVYHCPHNRRNNSPLAADKHTNKTHIIVTTNKISVFCHS